MAQMRKAESRRGARRRPPAGTRVSRESPASERDRRADRLDGEDGEDTEDEDLAFDEPSSAAKNDELVDGLGYGDDDGPESQGASAGHGFGQTGQGTFGDEDYDLSYGPTGLAGPEEIDDSERGADTPERMNWNDAGDASSVVANEERDVATGDLAALEEVRKKTGWSGRGPGARRPDDRIRDEIGEILGELREREVSVEVKRGEVLLLGSVATDERRDLVDERVQEVEGVRAIENQIVVRDDDEAV